VRLKIFYLALLCLILFVGTKSIEEKKVEFASSKGKQHTTMNDITRISLALVDYIYDNKTAPKQSGTYNENSELYKVLVPFYIRNLPLKDSWGNNFRIYCGEDCNGIYDGITGCSSEDFVIVSYGRDGKKENWEFDHKNLAGGLYVVEALGDFDNDLIMWDRIWIRVSKLKRKE